MEFTELATVYGVEVAVIAILTILVVGFIKVVFKKGFAKLEKDNCKPIYEALSIVLAYGLMAAWLGIKLAAGMTSAFDWQVFLKEASVAYAAVKVAYPLYENFKLRDLLQAAGKGFLKLFKKKVPEVVVEQVSSIFEEPVIDQVSQEEKTTLYI